MTNQNIQDFVNSLVKTWQQADKTHTELIEEAISKPEGFCVIKNNRERGRVAGSKLTIRDTLLGMDLHLKGSARIVRRALENIEPHFAKGYYSAPKKPLKKNNN